MTYDSIGISEGYGGSDLNGSMAFFPDNFIPRAHMKGDVWLDGDGYDGTGANLFNNPSMLFDGSYYKQTIIHEIGHAVGLAHPHHTSNGYIQDASMGKPYSTMSYADYNGDNPNSSTNITQAPHTLMIADIAALQAMYGANMQHNTGDDVYTISTFSSQNYIYATIWDAGGNDTISWAGQTTSSTIGLAPGYLSSFGNIIGPTDTDLQTGIGAGSGLLGSHSELLLKMPLAALLEIGSWVTMSQTHSTAAPVQV